jgi:predicted RNase H-like HicB family nuclease
MRRVLHAFIRPGNEFGWVAECAELGAVTQGADLNEAMANLQEAVNLALEGEDLEELGLCPTPSLVVTMEAPLVPA